MTSTTQNEIVGIEQTVRRALNNAGYGSYIDYAGPVIEALTARENDIAEKLIDYAADAGASTDEVKHYLREIGMIVAVTEEDESDDEDNSDSGALGRIEQLLTHLTGRVDSLAEFARRNGYRA